MRLHKYERRALDAGRRSDSARQKALFTKGKSERAAPPPIRLFVFVFEL